MEYDQTSMTPSNFNGQLFETTMYIHNYGLCLYSGPICHQLKHNGIFDATVQVEIITEYSSIKALTERFR